MSSYKTLFTILLFVVVIFTICEGRGKIGGFRAKMNPPKTTHTRITKIKQKIYIRQSRPWGSGTSYNWNSYGSSGHIYGYLWYVRTPYYYRNRQKEPTICRNEFDNVMNNGSHYQWFICPTQNHTWDKDRCCGVRDHQYCCGSDEYRNYTSRSNNSNGLGYGRIIGPIVGVLMMICCCGVCAGYRRKNRMDRSVVNQTFVENIVRVQTQEPGPQAGYQAPYPVGFAQPPPSQQPYPPPQQPYPPPQHPYPPPQQPYPAPQQPPYPVTQPPYANDQLPYPNTQTPYSNTPQQPPYPANAPPHYPLGPQASFYPNDPSKPPIPPPGNQSNAFLPSQPPSYEEVASKVNQPSAPPV